MILKMLENALLNKVHISKYFTEILIIRSNLIVIQANSELKVIQTLF